MKLGQRLPSQLIGRLLAATVLLLAAASLQAHGEEAYYRLALAPSPPPCARNQDPDTRSGSADRCFGTRPDVTELEMPPGRIVYLDDTAARVPPAWIFAGPLLLHTADLLAPGLGYRFREGPGGLRLEIYREERMLSTPVVLDRWLPADTPDGEQIWIRVRRVP